MILTADNLGKRFNREWIFRNANIEFKPGVYAITGPNGSGKSTLLQVLWGQLPASDGTITYTLTTGPVAADEIHRHLAIATPYMELIEEFTLRELLDFHFSFKAVRDRKPLDDVLDDMELTHARNKTIRHFSSGMKQRLKLGLAFASEAALLFLDEPTTNLDRQGVEWYWKQLERRNPASLILVGSNLENEYPATATKINLLDYKQGY